MRPNTSSLISCLIVLSAHQPASAADGLCEPLRAFAASVNPGETKVLKFHTIFGSNFKDREQPGFGAKRCDPAGYEPARAVCVYFMAYGDIQIPGFNAKLAIECLSKKTRFDVQAKVHAISVSLKYGTEVRGSLMDIELQQDNELGGMVLTIAAKGY
jgi:hypothetical protein